MLVNKNDQTKQPMTIEITHLTVFEITKAYKDFAIARQMIEHIMLQFKLPGLPSIGEDGSSGRLIYELAKCWPGSHKPKRSLSDAVMQQKNPFYQSKVCTMSLIDLPTVWTVKGKEWHGSYLLQISKTIRKVNCYMYLRGDEFNRPVRYGDPYVLVTGHPSEWRDVDCAVEMVREEIRKHQRNCRCSYN